MRFVAIGFGPLFQGLNLGLPPFSVKYGIIAGSAGRIRFEHVASPQGQTGKGPSLVWTPRGDHRAPDDSETGRRWSLRMETGEVEAKALCGVGLKEGLRQACCVARTPEGFRADIRGSLSFYGLFYALRLRASPE